MKRKLLFLFTLSTFCFAQNNSITPYDVVIWQKSIGGENSEYLFDAIPTPDYGFLLIGSSTSNASGDIQKKNQGGVDYFIWKMNEKGHQEWQNSFGGNKDDFLTSLSLTTDGGYILGGYSNSDLSGDKTEPNFGNSDLWIIKLTPNGEIQWQKTIGAPGNDYLHQIIQTSDNGFLIGGTSDSPKSSLKKSNANQSLDYWIIKLNSNGEILWESSLGGSGLEELVGITELNANYFIIGNSNSDTELIKDKSKYWQIIKLNERGDFLDQYNHFTDLEQQILSYYKDTTTNEIFFVGTTHTSSPPQLFINKINEDLLVTEYFKNPLDSTHVFNTISFIDSNHFLISGNMIKYQNTNGNTKAVSNYLSLIFDHQGQKIWSKTIAGDKYDFLSKAITTRDGSLLLIGNSDSSTSGNKTIKSKGLQDFYLIKLGSKNASSERQLVEIYPNPTSDYTNVIINKEFEKATIDVFNLNGQYIKSLKVKYQSTPVNLSDFPPGIYIINVKYDNQSESFKVIKK